jgi:putative ABC transport system ATP-binding protein
METEAVVQIKNVVKTYGQGEATIRALRGVSFDVPAGKVITIMGPSGSGKSTLLNILGTMDVPTSGEVLLDGVNVANLPESKLAGFRKNSIGFVFQNFYLLPNMDVLGNILVPLIPYGITEKDRQRGKDIIKAVGLEGRENSPVNKLSGGQMQRVAIARALINNPKIILADEPTGNLDSETGKTIIDLLLTLTDQGKTVIIVTHDLRIGQMIKDHPKGKNIWLKDGELSEKATYNVACYDLS